MSKHIVKPPLRVVVLISGSGSNLQALMDMPATPQRAIEIVAVISNRADAFGLKRAQRRGIPTAVLSHRDYPDRESFDAALRQCIDRFTPDLVALAGFMRILTPGIVAHYRGRMLNIHPSLLPKYRGLHTHRRALEAGEQEHGASVHFVTAELDGGPVIIQGRVSVLEDDDERALASRVQMMEHCIYPQAVALFASGRLVLGENGRPWLDGAELKSAL